MRTCIVNYIVVRTCSTVTDNTTMRLLIWAAFGLLAACAAPPPVPVPPPPPQVTQTAVVDWGEVQRLLRRAEMAFADDDLIAPEDTSAYAYYLQILDLVPDNFPEHKEATRGLERIVERFIERAHDAIAYQSWATARSMLDRAALINPEHPGIASMRSQVEILSSAQVHELKLDTRSVRERQSDISKRLMSFGELARTHPARVIIRASSDAEGRWMFQQLNRSSGAHRIRGEITIGRPPMVRVMVLPDQTESAE